MDAAAFYGTCRRAPRAARRPARGVGAGVTDIDTRDNGDDDVAEIVGIAAIPSYTSTALMLHVAEHAARDGATGRGCCC
eukprot:COSAG02_NODE_1734_length_11163_cov_43.814262_3_plen_79_part_00